MHGVAFYAPLKPPDHPVPSGDRTMARNLMAALEGAGLGPVRLASRLRTRDGRGDAAVQEAIVQAAGREVARLADGPAPALWLTYHSYYKAPDLLGPALADRWGIPYAIVEASRAPKRLEGPHVRFAAAAEAACDRADIVFYMTGRDLDMLERLRPSGQRLVHLHPFLGSEAVGPARPARADGGPLRLLACGMFRAGDKLASYAALAAALTRLRNTDWTLDIAGDGPERAAVAAAFAPFGERVRLLGELGAEALESLYAGSDLLVWPGVGEAFGMVYLEAQAQGCPALAEDRPGVRDVVRDGGWLTSPGDPAAFAAAIGRLAGERAALAEAGERGRRQVETDHLLPSARTVLAGALAPLLQGRRP